MQCSKEQIDELASKIDIVDYIGQTEELQRKGQNYFINCPFHPQDDTPSLCIYPDNNSWYCFGCKCGGNVINWIMKKSNVSFKDAVTMVANNVGISIEDYKESKSLHLLKTLKNDKNKKQVITDRNILDWNTDYYSKFVDEPPTEWIREGMTEEALSKYNIRLDENANRIVYPVLDSKGNLVSVKGRTRYSNYKELGLNKYMNYHKIGTIDYFQGFQQAEEEIKNKRSVIIFEGVKSCIKAYGWGIKNTMAAETSKLSDGQLRLLIKLGLSEVVIAWDKDIKTRDIINDQKIKTLKMYTRVSIVQDVHDLLNEKMSPVDKGKDVFMQLYNERIFI